MTRKDTILISVIVNTVLLAILFATAVIYDGETEPEASDFITPLAEGKAPVTEVSAPLLAVQSAEDEVDHVLKYYVHSPVQPVVGENRSEEGTIPEPIAIQTNASEEEWVSQESAEPRPQEGFVEMTVKKGDALEKIAKANGTTVEAIKKANQLSNERLSIGQVLKIPLKKALSDASSSPKKTNQEKKLEASESEAVYYVIKNGDNPWKIAKQFNVKYEDILKLNQLDEERSRNMKVGERIRVK